MTRRWVPSRFTFEQMARVLHDALPKVGEPCFLYVMELELLKEISPEANPKGRKFVDPKNNVCCFGFLSAVRLPKVSVISSQMFLSNRFLRFLHTCDKVI